MSSTVVVGIASVLTSITLSYFAYGQRRNESSTPLSEMGCLFVVTAIALFVAVMVVMFYFSGASRDDLRSVSGTIVEIEEREGGFNPIRGGYWIAFRLAGSDATFEYGSNYPRYQAVRDSLGVGDVVTVWTDGDADDDKPTVWGIDTANGELISFDEMKRRHQDVVVYMVIALVVGMIVLGLLWTYYARQRRLDKFFSSGTTNPNVGDGGSG
jgi:multisubunit Na+/H+ antiporter MnhB subunit